jgi:periplasmic protein CpxP/Spy
MNWPRGVALSLRLVVVSTLLLAVAAKAQPPMGMGGPPGGGASINVKKFAADRELTRLTKKYKLTPEQKAKIQPILADQEKQVHGLGDDDSLSNTDYIAAVRKVHQQTVMQVKAQMAEDQAAKYIKDEEKQAKSDAEDDQQQQGPPGGGPPGGGGGPPPGM